jgi:tetratricopeptide (TPR) repeat protein
MGTGCLSGRGDRAWRGRLPESLPVPIFLAAALFASACAPGVYVRRLVPAPTNLGASRTLALVAVRGQVIGVEAMVAPELLRQAHNRKHFRVLDLVPRRLAFGIPPRGQRADMTNVLEAAQADYYLIATLTDLRQFNSPVVRADQTRYRAEGTARLQMELVRADGLSLGMFAATGTAQGPDPFSKAAETEPSPNDLPQRAAARAIDKFLDSITPRFVTEKIVFEAGEDLKAGIKLAQDEDFEGAKKLWQELVAKNPNHAGAIYNIGVIYEVQGEYEGAKQWYRRAIELNPKRELYLESERALFKRLDDAARLQQ